MALTDMTTSGTIDKVLKNLRREIKAIKGRTGKGLYVGGLHLKGASQKEVPVVTGNLRASAYVVGEMGRKSGAGGMSDPAMESTHDKTVSRHSGAVMRSMEPEARVGYSAVYALSVHENPRAGQTGGKSPYGLAYSPGLTEGGNQSTRIVFAEGGKWKFLEDPLKAEAGNILKIVRHYAKER